MHAHFLRRNVCISSVTHMHRITTVMPIPVILNHCVREIRGVLLFSKLFCKWTGPCYDREQTDIEGCGGTNLLILIVIFPSYISCTRLCRNFGKHVIYHINNNDKFIFWDTLLKQIKWIFNMLTVSVSYEYHTNMILMLNITKSTFPIVVIFFRSCVSEMVVLSYSVIYYIYIPGKLGLCFHFWCSVYDFCKRADTLWPVGRVRLFADYTISLLSLCRLIWKHWTTKICCRVCV